jgi:CheY-like chemotaxis protein
MKKILIVEDEPSLSNILKESLEKEHYLVATASNGAEGLGAIKKEKPDLVLLDIVMPVMDGLTMAQKMRTMPEGKDLPVIMLTNYDQAENVEKALAENAFDFLVKSKENLDEIVEKVNLRLK